MISYRQNTDLFVQAWHWNLKRKWSDPAGKGYFTGAGLRRVGACTQSAQLVARLEVVPFPKSRPGKE